MARHDLIVSTTLLLVIGGLTIVCRNPAGPDGDCSGGLSFTMLPVPASAIMAATPLGNVNPPSHTIPSDHVGIYLNGTGVTLSSPAPLRITEVRTTQYLSSPFRAGLSDYAITTAACGGHTVSFGHIQTAVAKIQDQVGTNCETYSTADETVKACRNSTNISLAAGETIGTVGGATAPAFDFGVYQTGHTNGFVNPGRYSDLTKTAVCPYDPFTSDLRSQVDALIGFALPFRAASGESPRCGTMNIDVAGTARGAWVQQSNPVNQSGDETPFLALMPHPLFPESGQAISAGSAGLADFGGTGLPLSKFPVTSTGRVNRAFRDVTADAQIYCYVSSPTLATNSYFIRLSGSVLTAQRITHGFGASPCSADPSTWAFDGTAVNFIR